MLCASQCSSLSFIIVVVIIVEIEVSLIPWNAIALLRPGAEIDEPAAFRTKRPMRVISPRDFFAASRAFHFCGHGLLASKAAS